MTISSSTRTAGPFTGTGSLVSYPFAFKVFQASDLLIQQTDTAGALTPWTLGSNYTVTLNSDQNTSPGGNVTPLVALPSGYTLNITSAVSLTQGASLTNAGGFFPKTIEDALDRLTVLLQQAGVSAGGALRVPETTGIPPLPSAATRAGYLLGFDGVGGLALIGAAAQSATALALSLVSVVGTTLIGLKRAVSGAVFSTLYQWVEAQRLNVKADFSAAGNKVTDDTVKFQAAIDGSSDEIEIYGGVDSLVTTLTNPLGKQFTGFGRMSKAVTGGLQQLNLHADGGQHVFGQEYLFAWMTALASQSAGAQTAGVFCGDSTTYGAGGNGATAPYLINQIVEWLGRQAGFNVALANNGHPGASTAQWRTSYLAADIAARGKLMVIRYGINEPGVLKNGTAAPADAGQDYPNRRDVTDFATDLRGALTTIRGTAGCDLGNLSILLMTPNSTSDTPNGRDERWYEQVRLVVRQAARDFQCAFIDTYALWPDSRHAADLWMDNAFGDGRAVHPHNVMNGYIGAKIADLLYPAGLRPSYLSVSYGDQTSAANPQDFKMGINLEGVTAGDNFPGIGTGAVMTIRTPDNAGIQIAWDTSNATAMPAIRVGTGAGWSGGAWISRTSVDLTTSGAWVNFDVTTDYLPRVTKHMGMVTLWGAVKGGSTTAGAVITVLPVSYRPYRTQWFSVPCGASMDTHAVVSVQTNGNVIVQSVSSNGGLSLCGITFQAYA